MNLCHQFDLRAVRDLTWGDARSKECRLLKADVNGL